MHLLFLHCQILAMYSISAMGLHHESSSYKGAAANLITRPHPSSMELSPSISVSALSIVPIARITIPPTIPCNSRCDTKLRRENGDTNRSFPPPSQCKHLRRNHSSIERARSFEHICTVVPKASNEACCDTTGTSSWSFGSSELIGIVQTVFQILTLPPIAMHFMIHGRRPVPQEL